MIFAHGPLGALASRSTWRLFGVFNFRRSQLRLLLIAGFIGGIFPDIDFLYVYFIDGSVSHRSLITHTFPIYIVAWAVLAFGCYFLKRPLWFAAVTTFVIGVFTHLCTDMIASNVRILYPLNERYFGLTDLGILFVNDRLLLINFLIEGFFISWFLIFLVREFVNTYYHRMLTSVVVALFVIGAGVLLQIQAHAYRGPAMLQYGDVDSDGIVNYLDEDMDGDGKRNRIDGDSDGDGIDNTIELRTAGNAVTGVYYDVTEGVPLRIMQKMGFISNHDMPWRLFRGFGIFLDQEIHRDALQHPDGYQGDSGAEDFAYRPANIKQWFAHTSGLTEGDALLTSGYRSGDILFFADDTLYVVVDFTESGDPVVVNMTNSGFGSQGSVTSLSSVLVERVGNGVIAKGSVFQ